ncbi:MAG: hypothetical protein AAFQ82_18740, partial [Myxococcota bacterium]
MALGPRPISRASTDSISAAAKESLSHAPDDGRERDMRCMALSRGLDDELHPSILAVALIGI